MKHFFFFPLIQHLCEHLNLLPSLSSRQQQDTFVFFLHLTIVEAPLV